MVAPGFIDIHTHYDAQVFWDPALTPSCFHGVTTVVAGNCGFSIAPTRPEHRDLIARTLEKVEDMDVAAARRRRAVGDVRDVPRVPAAVERSGLGPQLRVPTSATPRCGIFVMGDDASDRAATPDEIAAMPASSREAMDAGAAGFATSFAATHRGADGKPIPSRWAERSRDRGAVRRARATRAAGCRGHRRRERSGSAELYDLQPAIGARSPTPRCSPPRPAATAGCWSSTARAGPAAPRCGPRCRPAR